MNKIIHFIFLLVIDALAVAATVLQIQQLSILIAILAAFSILKGTPIQSFYTILGTCLLSSVFGLSTFGMYFLLMLLAYIKIDGKILQTDSFAPWVFFLLLIYVIHDMQYSTIGWTVYYTSYLLYLFKVLSVVDWRMYNHKYATSIFLMSIVLTQVGSTLLTGDLSMLSDESAMNVRFGEGDVENGKNNNLGGAMDFPIHTILFMTLSLPMIIGNWISKFWKLVLAAVFIVLFVMTFFTTSRVYLLGLGIFGILMMFFLWKRNYGLGAKLLSVIILFAAIYVFFRTGLAGLVNERYTYRNDYENGAISSRYIIAVDCISYLLEHPIDAIFGLGYKSYSEIGRQLNMAFGMTAHNTVLDCILAFGIYGFVLICSCSYRFYKNIKLGFEYSTTSILSFAPFICWFVMGLTNSGFMNPKTYVLIPFLLLHTVYCYQLQEKDSL